MPLKCIRLELARDPDFPEGSRERGYEFAAPLDERGRLQPGEWRANRVRCRVKRLRPGGAVEVGSLVWRDGVWAFDCSVDDDGTVRMGFKLSTHRFVPGEYIAFREGNGVQRIFRVARVADMD